jgi:hypothetical protein
MLHLSIPSAVPATTPFSSKMEVTYPSWRRGFSAVEAGTPRSFSIVPEKAEVSPANATAAAALRMMASALLPNDFLDK